MLYRIKLLLITNSVKGDDVIVDFTMDAKGPLDIISNHFVGWRYCDAFRNNRTGYLEYHRDNLLLLIREMT